MSIFDRIGRMARAEVSEMKRVLREARDSGQTAEGRALEAGERIDALEDQIGAFQSDERRYQADIASAEAELARDHDALAERMARELGTPEAPVDPSLAAGASLWGKPSTPAAPTTTPPTVDSNDLARGASLWGAPATPPAPTVATPPAPTATPPAPTAATPARDTSPRTGRTETFPRDIREAYAALELPLGSDRSRIDQSATALLERYHPDRHAHSPEMQQTALALAEQIRAARKLLFDWLEGRR
jgi:hypothetical protein